MMHSILVAIQIASFVLNSHSANADICQLDWENVEICTPISKEDISDPCVDETKECAYWAKIGECKKNPNYMLTSCAKSCNQCPSFFNSQSPCLDLKEKCNDWASLGECEKNPNYMTSNCAKSCNKCPAPSNQKIKERDNDLDIPQIETFDGMSGAEEKATKAQIKAMKKYASLYLNRPSTTSTTVRLCKNQLDKCAYYASKGLCEDKVVFMMDNCPLACMMCDKAQQFAECVGMRELQSLPVFISDDEFDFMKKNPSNYNFIVDEVQTIDSFFRSKKENGAWVESGVEYILESSSKSNNDGTKYDGEGGSWMVRFGNFLTSEECKAIANLGHTMGLEEKSNNTPLGEKRKEREATYSFKQAKCSQSIELCNDHKTLSSVQERISNLMSISQDYFEPAEIVLYPGGSNGFHTVHHDYDFHDSWKSAGPRVLSLYIPLSDVEAGGYLGFPILDWLMIPPQAGQLILWPNVLSENLMEVDERMAKEVLPPRQGDLYVLHVRIHLYNYTSASMEGCV
mmetsp:Transcript_10722/g.16178  ORF Transcript_10722/g.16178 Transcript_10722/m.16178 type:complete len:514 (-) Transcript_10722:657-2198(-)